MPDDDRKTTPLNIRLLHLMEQHAQAMASWLQGQMHPGMGFCLMYFTQGGSEMTYVSNCNREDTVSAIKEMLFMLENDLSAPPGSSKEHPALRDDEH